MGESVLRRAATAASYSGPEELTGAIEGLGAQGLGQGDELAAAPVEQVSQLAFAIVPVDGFLEFDLGAANRAATALGLVESPANGQIGPGPNAGAGGAASPVIVTEDASVDDWSRAPLALSVGPPLEPAVELVERQPGTVLGRFALA